MKLLFLDIDGVLNSKRSETVTGKEKTVNNLDPVALSLVQKVVEETGAVVCLTSNWRFNHYILDLGKKMDLPIIYQTPGRDDEDRTKEIEEYLSNCGKLEAYAVLDDLPLSIDRLVKVDPDNGVSYDNYKQLMELLN